MKRDLIEYKKAQMKLSFGMIFSILLIIIFIAFAFYAINKFLNLQKTVEIETFVENLQADVNKIWASSKGSQQESYSVPKRINSICFVKNEFGNLQFISEKDYFLPADIEHLDILKIIGVENQFCIPNVDGKITLTLKKDFGENSVTITR